MTLPSLSPFPRQAGRRAIWSAICEAGPSRYVSPPTGMIRRAFQSGSTQRSDADDRKVDSSDRTALPHIEGISAGQDTVDGAEGAAMSSRDTRDPYSLNEGFLQDVVEDNADAGKLAGFDGGAAQDRLRYDAGDEDGGKSKLWLDALTTAIPDSTSPRNLPPAKSHLDFSSSRSSSASSVPASHLTDNTVKSRLSVTWNQSKPLASPPPRIPKGIHQKNKRLQGMTPSEAEAIASLLRAKVDPSSYPFGAPDSNWPGPLDVYWLGTPDMRGQGLYGYDRDSYSSRSRAIRAQRRLTERPDDPNRELIEERLQELKEDAMAGQTDVDLLEWAKRRVFVQEKLADGSEGFHPVYPHILAFLLDTFRRRFQSPNLVLSVFAYAQNLSPESYISGCLAPAYNEVLWVKWESFRDIEGVEQTIREMEANGVRWDKGTYQVVNEVAAVVGKDVFERGMAKRWGDKVYEILGNLDRKAAMDVDQQEQIYELQKKEKARRRQERTMMEYQQRRGSLGGAGEERWDAARY